MDQFSKIALFEFVVLPIITLDQIYHSAIDLLIKNEFIQLEKLMQLRTCTIEIFCIKNLQSSTIRVFELHITIKHAHSDFDVLEQRFIKMLVIIFSSHLFNYLV